MNIPPGALTQTANYIQSNDLVYRTVLDIVGFDIPYYLMGRNKDEKRELKVHIAISTLIGFIFAPLYVLGLNKVLAKTMFKGNDAFFKLNWQHLEKGKEKTAVDHLQKLYQRLENRYQLPSRIDQLPLVKTQIQKALHKTKSAIEVLNHSSTPKRELLDNIFKAKRRVLVSDLLITSLGIVNIGPIKNWVTRTVAKKDRFTGTQNYLSDENLKKLTQHQKKHEKRKKIISKLLVFGPALSAGVLITIARKRLDSGKPLGKILKTLRDSFDYHNGIYIMLGALSSIYLFQKFNLLNVARDKYERVEVAIKHSLIFSSFWFGDLLFNGHLAKYVDKKMAQKHSLPEGIFYNKDKSGRVLVKARDVQDVIEEVTRLKGNKAGHHAGNVGRNIFYSGLFIHNLFVAAILYLGNTITRKNVVRDLQKIQQDTPGQKLAQ